MRRALLFLPLLAACAAPVSEAVPVPSANVRPEAVTLYRDTVTVRMRDGALCTGVREATSGPWTTRLGGCPHRWPVEVRRPTAAPRVALTPAAADPWVALTPPGGAPLGFAPPAPGR